MFSLSTRCDVWSCTCRNLKPSHWLQSGTPSRQTSFYLVTVRSFTVHQADRHHSIWLHSGHSLYTEQTDIIISGYSPVIHCTPSRQTFYLVTFRSFTVHRADRHHSIWLHSGHSLYTEQTDIILSGYSPVIHCTPRQTDIILSGYIPVIHCTPRQTDIILSGYIPVIHCTPRQTDIILSGYIPVIHCTPRQTNIILSGYIPVIHCTPRQTDIILSGYIPVIHCTPSRQTSFYLVTFRSFTVQRGRQTSFYLVTFRSFTVHRGRQTSFYLVTFRSFTVHRGRQTSFYLVPNESRPITGRTPRKKHCFEAGAPKRLQCF